MSRQTPSLLACTIALLGASSSIAINHELQGWQASATPAKHEPLKLHLSLTSTTTSELHDLFNAVSDPDSSSYGHHLTRDQLKAYCHRGVALSAPAVESWLTAAGVTFTRTGCGDTIELRPTVAQAESLFAVRMLWFEHPDTTLAIARTLEDLVLPAEIVPHVGFVSGLFNFPHVRKAQKSEHGPMGAASPQVNPALLKSLYGLGNTSFSGKSNASQAVVEFQGQLILADDLTKFETQFNLPQQAIRKCTSTEKDGKCTGMAGEESSLDVQYIVATGTGVPTDYYYNNAFDLMAWATWMQSHTEDLALVWSVSYGEGINGGIGGHIKVAYAHGLNDQFEKLALLGHSILIASGDSGVYDRLPLIGDIKFHPSFPACLPSVTAVGATQLEKDGSEDTAVAWSGGGFSPSEYFTVANASWQQSAVKAYLSSGVKLPASWQWDRNGRGLPDVAAVGVDFAVVTNGETVGVSGTSASCPTVAGIIALLNDARMAAGKPPLGFLNPFLYKNPSAFNDIKKGKNNGGGLKSLLPGFEATAGWDPLTGLGTPHYQDLLKAALA